ncbi:phosphogluconate dehydrogenase (NAD(+)-dependent, decarboxylating) [Thermocrinis minervae]|uniref:phosphogluconate dehydrogenase (NAD(+)-dependent, decarboxylating) n=1 Tax=Thermocrinis minervae TaxID=381751 RepID=UPI0009A6DC10|nr:decarboxylating 6-phosphogluconate dehydrogenase [Thermocrinis minervae]
MKVLVVGLGRMGGGIAKRLKSNGVQVFGYARHSRIEDIPRLKDLSEVESLLSEEDLIWLMVPHEAVDEVLDHLMPYLKAGQIVVDGGNSFYRDSQRRYHKLKERGVYFLDVGVSGGVYGEEKGYCLMIGGDEEAFNRARDVFRVLSYGGVGYAYLGPSGAGHFAKMVHNGIEYAMMQAIGEGFELLKESEFNYDLEKVAWIYNQGSVIRSWLMELTQKVFEDFGNLENVKAYVEDTGEGRWTVLEAIRLSVPVPTIADALFMRFRSRQENSFRDRLLAALRYEFGRHEVKKSGDEGT